MGHKLLDWAVALELGCLLSPETENNVCNLLYAYSSNSLGLDDRAG